MNARIFRTAGRVAALAGAVAGAVALALPAVAHHSTAMFDFTKTVELKGTIKEFQWTNPHTWTTVDVQGGNAVVEYGLEGMSPNYLSRNGWSKRTLSSLRKTAREASLSLRTGYSSPVCSSTFWPMSW